MDKQQRIENDYQPLAHYEQFLSRRPGQLVKGIIDGRNIGIADLADHIGVDRTSLSHYWSTKDPSPLKTNEADWASELIRALGMRTLKNGAVIDGPLDAGQIDLLMELNEPYRNIDDIRKVNATLFVHFDDFYPRKKKISEEEEKNAAILKGFFQNEWRPAFLADRTWHLHAFNQTVYLFFVDQSADPDKFLKRRDTWHLLGGKFGDDSRIRDVYDDYDSFFPRTVDAFANSVYPYLCTVQMRYVLARLLMLSDRSGMGFRGWWKPKEIMENPFRKIKPLSRDLFYGDQLFKAEAQQQLRIIRDTTTGVIRIPDEAKVIAIEKSKGKRKLDELLKTDKDKNIIEEFTGHWLGIWNPYNDEDGSTADLFQDLAETPIPGRKDEDGGPRIFYAAEYEAKYKAEKEGKIPDRVFYDNYPFHTNERPWVEDQLLKMEIE